MKVFVINMARSTERRASMEQQLSLLNLDYEKLKPLMVRSSLTQIL